MISSEDLGHRSVHCVGSPLVDLERTLVSQKTSGLDACRHVCEHEGDGLVLVDGDSHGLSFLRILGRLTDQRSEGDRGGERDLIHCATGDTNSSNGDRRTSVVKSSHSNLESDALFA
jgi:hypothetical protein